MGTMFLVIVDAFSKWLDVYATQLEVNFEKLKTLFAIHRIPERFVLDNSTCSTTSEFCTFCGSQRIIHTKSAPYQLSSNGPAKRAKQTLKDGLKRL